MVRLDTFINGLRPPIKSGDLFYNNNGGMSYIYNSTNANGSYNITRVSDNGTMPDANQATDGEWRISSHKITPNLGLGLKELLELIKVDFLKWELNSPEMDLLKSAHDSINTDLNNQTFIAPATTPGVNLANQLDTANFIATLIPAEIAKIVDIEYQQSPIVFPANLIDLYKTELWDTLKKNGPRKDKANSSVINNFTVKHIKTFIKFFLPLEQSLHNLTDTTNFTNRGGRRPRHRRSKRHSKRRIKRHSKRRTRR